MGGNWPDLICGTAWRATTSVISNGGVAVAAKRQAGPIKQTETKRT